MTFGSLFTGIGGIDLGLERAGMLCQWQVESDAYCRSILEKRSEAWDGKPWYSQRSTVHIVAIHSVANGLVCGWRMRAYSTAGSFAQLLAPRSHGMPDKWSARDRFAVERGRY